MVTEFQWPAEDDERDWKETTLGEICRQQGGSIQTGPFGSQLHASDYQATGIPVVMPVNLVNGRIDEKDIARVSPAEVERLARHKLNKGDIVFSRRGDVTRFALVSENETGWLCGTGCLKVSFGQEVVATSRFIAGALAAPDTKEWLIRHAVGATMPNLNTEILSAIPILLPPIERQCAIAHILGTLDDKIELNRQQNQTLEAMARALFKAWFVDFEPVRAKMSGRWQPGQTLPGLPAHLYDLFPDRLVESEFGKVPQGWEVKTLSDIASFPSKKIEVASLGLNNYISTENMLPSKAGVTRAASLPSVSKVSAFERGEILVSNIRPYFKKIWFAQFSGGRSNDVLAFKSKESDCTEFLFSLLSQDDFFEFMMRTSKGAKMPRGDKAAIAKWNLVFPGVELMRAFSKQVKAFYSQVGVCKKENEYLRGIRDALLPKLISGELRVENINNLI